MVRPVKITIEVDDSQLRDFAGRFVGNMSRFTTAQARGLAVMTRNRIRKVMKEKGMVVTGSLIKGTVVRKLSNNTYIVQSRGYLRHIERGTRRRLGPNSKQIPRLAGTMMWARKHGMSFWKMQGIIKKHGTKPNPFTRVTILRMKEEYLRDMSRRLNLYIQSGARKTETLGG